MKARLAALLLILFAGSILENIRYGKPGATM